MEILCWGLVIRWILQGGKLAQGEYATSGVNRSNLFLKPHRLHNRTLNKNMPEGVIF